MRKVGDALSLGIGMIHQHFKLVDVFTAQDNIVMGTEDVYKRQARRRAPAGRSAGQRLRYTG